MKLHKIYGIILRYLYLFKHSFDRIGDAFYWPTIDLLVWGLASTYFKNYNPEASQIVVIIVSGILFWIIVWQSQYQISVNLLEELWTKNLLNIFAAPVKFSEWIASLLIMGVIKAIISFSFASLLAYILYHLEIFTYGFYLLPFALILIMTGWWVGFFVSGLILRFGKKIQILGWAFVSVLYPFSAVFYPVSTLPDWAQKISSIIPITYVFEGARSIIEHGTLNVNIIYTGIALNVIYIILSLLFLRSSFKSVLKKGLIKAY